MNLEPSTDGFYTWTVALGGSIRARRKELGLTLKDLAGRTGICFGFLSQVEKAYGPPSIAALHKIAIGLETRIVDLLPPWPEQNQGGT